MYIAVSLSVVKQTGTCSVGIWTLPPRHSSPPAITPLPSQFKRKKDLANLMYMVCRLH